MTIQIIDGLLNILLYGIKVILLKIFEYRFGSLGVH